MDTFLQIVGALCLGSLLLIIVAYYLIKWKLRKLGRAIASAFAPPPRITLTPDRPWRDPAADAFEREGFTPAGSFKINEMPDLRLAAFVKPDEAMMAVVYDKPGTGVWVDAVVQYHNGAGVTVTSAPEGHQLDSMPGKRKFFAPGAAPSDLLARLRAERLAERPLPCAAKDFVERFQRAYAEEMDWRNSRGFATDEEVKRVADEMPDAPGEEVRAPLLALARPVFDAFGAAGIERSCAEAFLAAGVVAADDWARLRDVAVIVHDRMDVKTALGHFDESQAPEPTAREAFARLAEERGGWRRLGSIDEPVGADLYVPTDI